MKTIFLFFFFLIQIITADFEGTWKNTCTWKIYESQEKLVIGGTGEMGFTTDVSEFPWKQHSSKIKYLEVNGITKIAEQAFYNMAIESAIIGDSVTDIGYNAFMYCSYLKEVTLGNGLEEIYQGAFRYTAIESISIPEKVTTIGAYAFKGCTKLKTVIVHGELQIIEEEAFSGNTELITFEAKTSVVPKEDEYNNECEIENCNKLQYVLVPLDYQSDDYCQKPVRGKGVCGASEEACHFFYLFDEKKLIIEGNGQMTNFAKVDDVPWKSKLSEVENIEITGITSIGAYSFYQAIKITSLTIPSTVTSIGTNAFASMTRLQTVEYKGIVEPTNCQDNVFQNTNTVNKVFVSIEYQSSDFCGKLIDISGSCGNTETECKYFYDSVNKKLTIQGNGLMTNFASINDVPWKSKLTEVENIEITGITSISSYAISQMTKITSINIPSTVTSIGNVFLKGCSSLTTITVDGNNPNYSSKDNVLMDKLQTTLIQYPIAHLRTEYTIPSSVTTISNSAFASSSSLEELIIPSSITSVGDNAFSNCNSLNSVTFNGEQEPNQCPDNAFTNSLVTTVKVEFNYQSEDFCGLQLKVDVQKCGETIEECQFEYNPTTKKLTISGNGKMTEFLNENEIPWKIKQNEIKEIVINNGIQNIGSFAFILLNSLTTITIPSSVKTIGKYAFAFCSSLTSISLPSTLTSIEDSTFLECTSLKTVTLPQSLQIIGSSAFEYCSQLSTLSLPSSIRYIGSTAFSHCSSLQSISIPNNVNKIRTNTFYKCSSLTSVTMPEGIQKIEHNAFSFCSELETITIPKTVTSIERDVFIGCTKLNKVIYQGNDEPEECTIETFDLNFDGTIEVVSDYSSNDFCEISLIKGDIQRFDCGEKCHAEYNMQTKKMTIKGEGKIESLKSISRKKEEIQLITIEDQITELPANIFEGFSSLKEIIIGKSVQSIGKDAFKNCPALSKVQFTGTVEPTCNENLFEESKNLKYVLVPTSYPEDNKDFCGKSALKYEDNGSSSVSLLVISIILILFM